ncbi:bacterial extracellular solute-binding protein [Legionella sainthelensi]|nr:bacterial extracellular solute-binding protein [Legionella sainthelensi]
MSFFAPVPWEADIFYSQPGMADNNITLSWYPIGTGSFMLVENNPNRSMVLKRILILGKCTILVMVLQEIKN